jgi:peptide/nickel transport system substrate-binding protein
MKRRATLALAAIAAGSLILAACGSSVSGGGTSGGVGESFNAGSTSVVNPSDHKGGTIVFDDSGVPDSLDGGNVYYAWTLNFNRLFETPLTTYPSCPGKCGLGLVPGLATNTGTASKDGLTWTFHLKSGVTYSNGQPVTAQDIKYAVERTFDRSVLPNGPSYFQVLLGGNAARYPGPFKDRAKNLMGLTAITTPDAHTIEFHLAKPFPDFPYVVAFPQTAPVPPNADSGANGGTNYQQHVLSTGPYMLQSYSINKQAVFIDNLHWNPSWDPQAKQLASKIILNLNVNDNDIDSRLLHGDIQVDASGTGVQAAARAQILSSPSLEKHADDPLAGFAWFVYINTKVAPLTNLACRRAVEYAANKVDLQTAYGGPVAGGAIASTVMLPITIGYRKFDLYEATSKPTGDLTRAKAELKACGQPSGFTTGIAYRSDRSKEVSAAQALQAALARVGIKLQLHGYPSGTYYTNFAGVPNYVHQHGLGLDIGGWAADWPTGYGFLDAISNGNAIPVSGNANIAELNDPVVNNLFAKSNQLGLSTPSRSAIWPQIDTQIMNDAGILPEVYAKSLLYRSPSLTNVYVQPYYGMYNYAVLGMT